MRVIGCAPSVRRQVSPGDASAVRRYATAAVHSTCSLLLPYAAAAHAASLRLRPLFTAGVTTGAWGAAAAAADGESEIDLAEQAAQKDILRLCAQLDAQLAGNHVARRASSATGAALLRAAAAAFPAAVEVSAAFEAVQGSPSPHFAVAFGCVYGALGVPWPTAARAYAFTAVRDIVSAATRLNVIGPMVRLLRSRTPHTLPAAHHAPHSLRRGASLHADDCTHSSVSPVSLLLSRPPSRRLPRSSTRWPTTRRPPSPPRSQRTYRPPRPPPRIQSWSCCRAGTTSCTLASSRAEEDTSQNQRKNE